MEESSLEVVKLLKFQQGGSLAAWVKSLDINKLKKNEASKTESTKTVIAPHAKPAGTITLPNGMKQSGLVLPSSQGEIKSGNKSLRETIMSGVYKLNDSGNGNGTMNLLTSPILAGGRLLRADKYFNSVQSDSDLKDALFNVGMDALEVAPVGAGIAKAGKFAGEVGTAFNQSVKPYITQGKNTWNATKNLAPLKRLDNAVYTATTAKQVPGDVMGRSFFNMDADHVANKINKERNQMAKGGYATEGSLSINSSPLFFKTLSRLGKDYKVIRTGKGQLVNTSGYKGNRVFDAIPEQLKEGFMNEINSLESTAKMLSDNKGMQKSFVQSSKDMLSGQMLDMAANQYPRFYREFLENYKPIMDEGITALEKKTGLGLKPTKLKEAHEGTFDAPFYVQPTVGVIKNPNARLGMVAKDILKSTQSNYILNKANKGAGPGLKSFIQDERATVQSEMMRHPSLVKSRINGYQQFDDARQLRQREVNPDVINSFNSLDVTLDELQAGMNGQSRPVRGVDPDIDPDGSWGSELHRNEIQPSERITIRGIRQQPIEVTRREVRDQLSRMNSSTLDAEINNITQTDPNGVYLRILNEEREHRARIAYLHSERLR